MLDMTEYFVEELRICIILGDNILENNICEAAEAFAKQDHGANHPAETGPDAHQFRVAETGRPKRNSRVDGNPGR